MAPTPGINKGICLWAAVALVLLPPGPFGVPGRDRPVLAEEKGWLEQLFAARPQSPSADAEIATETEPGAGRSDVAEPDALSTAAPSAGATAAGEEGVDPADSPLGIESIHVSKAGTVEMHVADVPLSTVLEVLSVQSRRNIIATPNVSGTVTAHLYNVTFEEALDAILVANQAGYREVGNFIYVYTHAELSQIIAAETPPVTRVIPLYYINAADALAIATPLLSELGTAVATPAPQTGLGSDAEQAGGDSTAQQDYLVVRDRPVVIDHIAQTLAEVDVRPTQVLVEATILSVTLDDANALGVDFTVVGGVDLKTLGSTSVGVENLTVGELPQNRFDLWNSNVTTDFTQIVPDGGLRVGVIDNHVAVFVRALEEITDTTVLANPKVLALNKQRALVMVGRRDGYITTTVTETQAIQNVEFLETGTRLIFRPFVGAGGFVRMELHPEDSVGTVANGLPSEQTTEVTTNVIVQDGQTILIGGLFREVTSENRNQVPLLGDIPIVGTIFQGRTDRTVREEVVILLTVHIVKDQDAYARAGERARQDAERIRVGVRRKLMWNGRERLAQAHYHWALEHFANGNTEKALWDVQMALHNFPGFVSAIELKEEILGKRDWDDEGTATRDFIHQLIMKEHGLDEADFGRPAPPFVSPFEESREDQGLNHTTGHEAGGSIGER